MISTVLIIFLASQAVNANGNVITFQELVCQHCNALHGQDEAVRVGKSGAPGAPGPRGPPGQVNETALRELVRHETKIGCKGSWLDINETVVREIIQEEIELGRTEINETAIRDIVKKEFQFALESFRLQSKVELERFSTTAKPATTAASREWTVFQRRMDGSVDFYRDWIDYVNGFGNEAGEFWLGLEKIYQLTKSRDKELQIDMIASDGRYFTARYNLFHIGGASDAYRVHLSGYSGNATNSFLDRQNKMQFTTKDSDHDGASLNCAIQRKGGWWFENCFSNLNGIFGETDLQGIRWFNDNTRNYIRMRYTEMKIRRRV